MRKPITKINVGCAPRHVRASLYQLGCLVPQRRVMCVSLRRLLNSTVLSLLWILYIRTRATRKNIGERHTIG